MMKAGSAGRAGRRGVVIGVLGAGHDGRRHRPARRALGRAHAAARPDPRGARARASSSAKDGLRKEAAKGRLTRGGRRRPSSACEPVDDLAALAPCELVIEAAPERLELKHELYARLSEIVSEECVLATNTSSLLVTAIAAAASHPERVVGHALLQPRAADAPARGGRRRASPRERALALAHATGEAMGKTVIRAKRRARASSSTAATARSAWRRCACCRSGSRTSRRSTASAAWRAAFAWGRSS